MALAMDQDVGLAWARASLGRPGHGPSGDGDPATLKVQIRSGEEVLGRGKSNLAIRCA